MKQKSLILIIIGIVCIITGYFIGKYSLIPDNKLKPSEETTSPKDTPTTGEIIFPASLDEMTFNYFSIKDQEQILEKGKDAYNESRIEESKTIIKALRPMIKEGDSVADIGAGTGYFTLLLSQMVGQTGRVYAVDIDPKSLIYIMYARREMAKGRDETDNLFFDNISIILNEPGDLTLPADSFNLGIMLNVHLFHYKPGDRKISNPGEDIYGTKEDQEKIIQEIYKEQKDFIRSVFKGLRKDGKFVVIEDISVMGPSPRLRKENVARLLEKEGFMLEKDLDVLPHNHFLIFKKQ
ncbi:MAG: class I SAM-dependent methyltransferase [Candidatus Eremiobacteraeota bacterium]|nr:class I SAM-dependent methyltransferase [Candidatus Eremiobacteraeota bacterium]